MTVRGYPFDTTDPAGSVTELEWRRMMRWLLADRHGVIDGQENELLVQERSAGANMSVEVLTGQAFAVGNYGRNDATLAVPIENGDPANPRIDVIVFGWNFATNTAAIYVLEGVPAGAPVPTAVTQDITTLWEEPLAEVAVAANESVSIQSADITDVREMVDPAAADPPVGARAKRTAGSLILNSTSWANVDTGLDLVLAAEAGDLVIIGAEGQWANEAIWGWLDFATIVAAAPVNSVARNAAVQASPGTTGIPGLAGHPSTTIGFGGTLLYVVQAGDVSGGNVTFRLRYATSAAANKTLFGSTNDPLDVWAVNFRH